MLGKINSSLLSSIKCVKSQNNLEMSKHIERKKIEKNCSYTHKKKSSLNKEYTSLCGDHFNVPGSKGKFVK